MTKKTKNVDKQLKSTKTVNPTVPPKKPVLDLKELSSLYIELDDAMRIFRLTTQTLNVLGQGAPYFDGDGIEPSINLIYENQNNTLALVEDLLSTIHKMLDSSTIEMAERIG